MTQYVSGREDVMSESFKYVYVIQHNKTGRAYIGCSQHIQGRYQKHIEKLRNRSHKSEQMQKDFDDYGEDFSVHELERIIDAHIQIKGETYYLPMLEELKWMRRFDSVENGYNRQDRMAKRMLELERDKL